MRRRRGVGGGALAPGIGEERHDVLSCVGADAAVEEVLAALPGVMGVQ